MAKKIDYGAMFERRKDGRYQYRYFDSTGMRKYLYDRDPEKLYAKVQAIGEPTDPTFREIAESWHDACWDGLAGGTRDCYGSSYKRALDRLGDIKASEVSTADITRHLEKLKAQGLGQKSVKTQRTVYSIIYKHAINDDALCKFVTRNPAADAKLPKGLKSKKREAPEDDVLAKIRSGVETAEWGLFAMFLVSTGCRRGEALAVTWGDIDRKAKLIHINKAVKYSEGISRLEDWTKTEAGERSVPLLPDLARVLIKPAKAKPTDYVFKSPTGQFMPQSTYRRRWREYCKAIGVEDLTAHELRHGYATMLFEAEVDVYTAQKLLGHSDIKTTMAVYTHLRDRKKQKSIDKLVKYVNNDYSTEKPKKKAAKVSKGANGGVKTPESTENA